MPPSSDPSDSSPAPRRVLTRLDATGIVIGAVIGVGIFFTPSRVARVAGGAEWALAAWCLGGLIAMLGAMSFAELGGRYDRSAGQYEILRDAYGPLPAFLFVFCNSTAIQSGATAIIALVCSLNLGVALRGSAPAGGWLTLSAAALIAMVIAVNVLGVRLGAVIQNATSLAKIVTLLLIAALAAWMHVSGASPAGSREPAAGASWSGLLAAVVPTAFSYGGWQHVLWIGGEVREPRRNVPQAILLGMGVVVTVYLLANWAYLSLLGYQGVAESPALAADAVARVWPDSARRLIAAAIGLSALGVLNAQLLSGPRLVFGMAADGRFFRPFARLNSRFRTPHAAILLIGGIGLLLVLTAGSDAIDKLLTGVVAVDGVFFALTGGALFILRRKHPLDRGAFHVPGYPFVPAAFVVCEVAVVAGSLFDPAVRQAALIGGAWILGAAICYGVWFRGRT